MKIHKKLTTKARHDLSLACSGIGQSTVANKLGISKSHISMICTGKRMPSRKLAHKIAEVFNIPAGWWV